MAGGGGREKSRLTADPPLQFGGGSRVCLGKNISLEISKTIPMVVRHFDLSVCEASMATTSSWFVWPRYTCRVAERRRTMTGEVRGRSGGRPAA